MSKWFAFDDCYQMAFPYYKAIRINSLQDIDLINCYRSPGVLVEMLLRLI